MGAYTPAEALDFGSLPDRELVELARQRHPGAFRIIMQRHNRRLYRIARGVLRDGNEAEDAVQEAYMRAFTALHAFRGEASLSTWLTRIVLNEALGRRRRKSETIDLAALDTPEERNRMQVISFPLMKHAPDPEQVAAQQDIRRVLERAIDALPEPFRVAFIMRDVEGMSVEETAEQLRLRPETVRTRLHRARRQLREAVRHQLDSVLTDAFPFAGQRCERMAEQVVRRLSLYDATKAQTEEQV